MKKILIKKQGGPSSLLWTSAEDPELTNGSVIVDVLACGVAYADVMAARGRYPLAPKIPFTPGYDFIGRISETGRLDGSLLKGQLVAGLLPRLGSFSERLSVDEEILVPLPAETDPVKAAAVTLNYYSAYSMIRTMTGLEQGQSLLIHGGAGGVGTAVLDLGRHFGLSVYGTASAAKHEIVRHYGGMPIDYNTVDFLQLIMEETGGIGVDACFDPIGGEHLKQSLNAVKKGGTLISFGFAGEDGSGGRDKAAGGFLGMTLLKLAPNGRKVSFFSSAESADKDRSVYRAVMTELFDLLAEGVLDPLVSQILPLEKAGDALTYLESGQSTGKTVLTTKYYREEMLLRKEGGS